MWLVGEIDTRLLVDVGTIVLAVYSGYLSTMRKIERRLTALEVKIELILTKDRRRRLADYDKEV